ncbi:sterol desaturase family protein [Undibacterium sp. SXout20W]|uniref:sterol desaturase family protein n=1 Tax=Undibacterium sp. SXout20W TaxID=3413051 RepID=UPI003BF39B05
MSIFKLEQTRREITFDFLFYGVSTLFLIVLLILICPSDRGWIGLAIVLTGIGISSLTEYFSHRFILHGIPPFSRWHQRHHDQPKAGIGTPTIVSAFVIFLLIFIPMLFLSELFYASALTLGVVIGYGLYSVTHHATHHWHSRNRWLMKRKRWHAMHHCVHANRCFGVTSSYWDHFFGTSKGRHSGNNNL